MGRGVDDSGRLNICKKILKGNMDQSKQDALCQLKSKQSGQIVVMAVVGLSRLGYTFQSARFAVYGQRLQIGIQIVDMQVGESRFMSDYFDQKQPIISSQCIVKQVISRNFTVTRKKIVKKHSVFLVRVLNALNSWNIWKRR